MTSFDLGAFEAAFPPTGVVVPGYGAVASTTTRPQPAPPGVYQHITVLNMSGKRATGSWTTQQETSHFTIEDGHIFNVRREGVPPIRAITISTGGTQPAYSNASVMPGATIAIVLNKDGGYSPLSSIDGTNGGGNGGTSGSGDSGGTTGGDGGGYNPARQGLGAIFGTYSGAASATPGPDNGNAGYAPERRGLAALFGAGNDGNGYDSERRGLGAIFGAPRNNGTYNNNNAAAAASNNGTLSFAPFGWRV
ncbi:hypothetical protein pneo_cds_83 [Pandoravirus neocaledonia]|uniref:Uncharacterized protein n=1 Tax=Pandoravirus neocaledonia TaxID=2107708 RepID=A0A2U7UBJ1_9VIRU|nr:hypothetical protein pneo_cds_83 [Pandoravirus neocaledonia]AVK75690.1 hypothetical protein pneo_cds_83 [Pandoravirus neocaledonia]